MKKGFSFRILSPILLLPILFVQVYAQAESPPKRFLIWDERGKFGYIDETGRVMIKPQFDRAYPFAEGLAAVGIGDKSGFIDASGQRVIPFQYYSTYSFSDGVAAVSMREGSSKDRRYPCGYIDHSNQFVIRPQSKFSCTPFHEGFAVVEEYDRSLGESYPTYLNKEGLTGVIGHLAVGHPFSEGLALVEDFTKWFFVNREGQTVIDLRPKPTAHPFGDRYVPAGSFSEGLARVGIIVEGSAGYSRYAFMNRKGHIVFKLSEDEMTPGDFYNGRAQVYCVRSERKRTRIGREVIDWDDDVSARGYIDTTGKIVIAPRFSRAEDFSEELAVVRVGHGLPIDDYNITPEQWKDYAGNEAKYYSCIDRSGRVVIERCGEPLTREEIAEDFQEFGRAFGKGFIDGVFFSKTKVQAAGKLKTVYGYMNRAGRYVWIQPPGTKIAPAKQ